MRFNQPTPIRRSFRVGSVRTLFVTALVAISMSFATGCEKKSGDDESKAEETEKAPELTWRTDYEAAMAEAAEKGGLVMIDFTATWCAPCQQLEKETFSTDAVAAALDGITVIKVDGSESMDEVEPLMEKHGVAAFPTVVFVKPNGETLASPKVTEFIPADAFVAVVKQARDAAK